MRCIKQFRYGGDGAKNNNPQDLSIEKLVNGNIFTGYGSISQLGIQAKKGTMVFLNNSIYPIVIGDTGIYEIDLQGFGHIYSISFAKAQMEEFNAQGSTSSLLIDIIYEGAGVDV